MTDKRARIFDVQRGSYADGPGIRTTVFFKGCNLGCAWCHNPEGQSFESEVLFYESKCTHCQRCERLPIDESFLCPNGAKEFCGRELDAEALVAEIKKDKAFYEASGGGVTFSGGECMLHVDFLLTVLKKCKELGIRTAVDTAGHVPWESFEKVIPYTDLFLYDVKSTDCAVHEKYVGVGNGLILDNLKKLLSLGVALWVRMPLITGVNASAEEMKRLRAFYEENGFPQKTELLPYHALGEGKYTALSREAQIFEAPDAETVKALYAILEK